MYFSIIFSNLFIIFLNFLLKISTSTPLGSIIYDKYFSKAIEDQNNSDWTTMVYCAEGYFAKGFQISQDACTSSGIKFFEMYCFDELGNKQTDPPMPLRSFFNDTTYDKSDFKEIKYCPDYPFKKNNFITGFRLWSDHLINSVYYLNHVGAFNLEISCQNHIINESSSIIPPYFYPNFLKIDPSCSIPKDAYQTSYAYCPPGQAVCGFKMGYNMYDPGSFYDYLGMTDLKFACCYLSCKATARLFFNQISKKCEPCHYSCVTCNGPNDDNCLTCHLNFIKNNGKCEPPYYYLAVVDVLHDNDLALFASEVSKGLFLQDPWNAVISPITNLINSCSNYYILGGYNKCNRCAFTKTIKKIIPHYKVRIQVRIFKIDSWDNEFAQLFIDDVSFSDPGLNFKILNDFFNIGDLCGNSKYYDDIYVLDVEVSHVNNILKVVLTSNLDGPANDESFGIRDLTIAIYRCDYTCLTCNGPEANQCTGCYPSMKISGGACICTNTDQYLVVLKDCPNSDSACSSCQDCDISCATCTGGLKTECTSCETNYFMNDFGGDKCVNVCPVPYWGDANLNPKKCVETCSLSNYFGDKDENRKCIECDSKTSKCATCVDSTTKCTSCISGSGRYLNPSLFKCEISCTGSLYGLDSTKQCVSDCPIDQFKHNVDKKCYLSCPTNFIGNPLTQSCVRTCPSNMFPSNNNICEFCNFDCASCTAKDICSTCLNSWSKVVSACKPPLNNYIIQENIFTVWISDTAIINNNWEVINSETPDNLISTCKVKLVGGYQKFGKDTYMLKKWVNQLPPHYKVRITFQFMKIGNWNNNKLLVYFDNDKKFELSFTALQDSASTKYCGDPTYNEALRLIEVYESHEGSTLSIKITTDLSSEASIASWGIYNLKVSIDRCNETCKTCSGSLDTDCIDCYPNAYRDPTTNKCLCSDNYFQTNVDPYTCKIPICSYCSKCHETCNKCTGSESNQCIDCKIDYYLNSNECKSSCPIPKMGEPSTRTCSTSCLSTKTYLDSNRICKPCHDSCLTCIGFLETDCKTCDNGKYLNIPPGPGKCTTTCDDGWISNSGNICKKCDNNCKTCVDIITKCTSCESNFLQDNICVVKCSGSLWGNLLNHKCETNCLDNQYENDDDKICYNQCLIGFHGNPLTKKCVVNCPDGMYSDVNNVCQYCDFDCDTCVTNNKNCLSCKYSWTKYGNTCLIPQNIHEIENKFSGGFTNNGDWNIQNSLDSTQSVTDCGSFHVLGGFGLFGKDTILEKTFTSYPPHYKARMTLNFIKIDNWNSNTFKIFINDLQEYSITFSSNSDSKLTKFCGITESNDAHRKIDFIFDHNRPSIKIKFTTDLTIDANQASWGISNLKISIFRCHETCKTCSGPLLNQCILCYDNAHKTSNNECVCNDHYYLDNSIMEFSCISPTCSFCNECDSSCNKCTGASENDCIDCIFDNFYDSDLKTCTPFCTDTKKGNKNTRKCENSCPSSHYYLDNNRICQICHDNCETCTGPSNTQCSTCTTTFLNEFPGPTYECLSGCLEGWFPDNSDHKCKKCDINCKTCTTLIICTSCENKFLLNNNCENSCVEPYYAVLSTHKCQLKCLNNEFEHDVDRKCYSVCPNLFYGNPSTKKCVANCPRGMFPDSNNICKFCDFDCETCINNEFYCSTCKFGWEAISGICQKSKNILKLENNFKYLFTQTDFENSGWIIENEINNNPSYITNCKDFHILGGYNRLGRNSKLTKIITNNPPHYNVRITFYLLKIDNWVSKEFTVKLNDNRIGFLVFETNSDSEMTQYCGLNEFNEAYRQIDFSYGDNLETIKFEITSNLDLTADQASWGIFDLTISIDRCHETCKKCIGPLQTDCTECYENAQKNTNNECKCIDHYYLIILASQYSCIVPVCSSCNICHPTCNKCQAETEQDCIDCNFPYYFNDGKCTNYCPEPKKGVTSNKKCEDSCLTIHEFLDSNRICQNCDINCNTCSGPRNDECLTCYSDKYLNYPPGPAYQCLTDCIDGWNPDPTDNKCKQCDINCKTCKDLPNKCMSCEYLFLDSSRNKCVEKCPLNYYGIISSHKCELNCLDNEFEHDVDRICYTKCPDPYHGNPFTKKCVLNCPDLMYSPSENNICNYCHFDCGSCSISSSYCDTCKYSWISNSGTCVKPTNIYEIGIFFNGNFLHNHVKSSWTVESSFSNSNYVNDCSIYHIVGGLNNFGMDAKLSKIFTNYPPHYKLRISFNFIKIDNWNNNKFIFKIDDEIKFNEIFSSNSDSKITQYCGSRNYNEAYRSIDVYIDHDSPTINLLFTSDLTVTADIASWGISNLKITIDKCHETCFKCRGSLETQCLDCYLNAYLSNDNKCLCNEKFYQTIIESCTSDICSSCQSCHSDCKNCIGPSSNQCLNCNLPLYFYQNECLPACPNPLVGVKSTIKCEDRCTALNEYIDSNRLCQTCHITCKTCTGATDHECIDCNVGNFLHQKQCLDECPTGLTINTIDNTCDNCDKNCKSCRGSTSLDCKSCFDKKFLFNSSETDSQCIETCPKGYYPDSSDNKCKKCIEGCLECLKLEKCIKCQSPKYYFYDNKCYLKCPDDPVNTYGDSSSYICVTNCLPTCYKNNETRLCTICPKECNTCLSEKNCLTCKTSYFLQNSTCVEKCDTGFFPNKENNCTKDCIENCVKCIDLNICEECNNSTYLNSKGICVKCYNGNEFINGKNCINCPDGCIKCNSTTKCEQCKNDYALNTYFQCVQIIKVYANLKNTLNAENIILEFSENNNLIFKNTDKILEDLNIEGLNKDNFNYRVEISKINPKIYNIFFSFKTKMKANSLLTISLFQNNLIGTVYQLQTMKLTLNLIEYNHCDAGYKYITKSNQCSKLIEINPELSLTSSSTILILSFSDNYGEIYEKNINNTIISILDLNSSYYSYNISRKNPSSDQFEISLSYSGPIQNHPLLKLSIIIDYSISYNESYLYLLNTNELSINLKNFDGTAKSLIESTSQTTQAMNSLSGSETMSATNVVSSGASFAIRAMMCMDLIRMLRFLQINYPEIVVAIFETDIKITNIVPDFDFDESTEDTQLPFIFKQFGMSIYLVNNIGCMILENLIYIGLAIFVIILAKFLKRLNNSWIEFIIKVVSSVLVWNFPLSYFMSSYLEYVFSSLLALRYYSIQTNFAIFNFLLALTVFISMIFSILLIFKKVRGIRKLKKVEHIQKIAKIPLNFNKISPSIDSVAQNASSRLENVKIFEKTERIERNDLTANENLRTESFSSSFQASNKISPFNDEIKEIKDLSELKLNEKDNSILSPKEYPSSPLESPSIPFKIHNKKSKLFNAKNPQPSPPKSVILIPDKVIEKPEEKVELDKFMILFNDFNQVTRWQGYYLIIDLTRQLFFSFIFISCYDHPIPGLVLLTIINIFMFYLILFKKPFNNRGDTIQTFVNEFFLNISYIAALMLAICDYNNNCNINQRNNAGWVILGCNFFLVGFFLIRFFILCTNLIFSASKLFFNCIKKSILNRNKTKVFPEFAEDNSSPKEGSKDRENREEIQNNANDIHNNFMNA